MLFFTNDQWLYFKDTYREYFLSKDIKKPAIKWKSTIKKA